MVLVRTLIFYLCLLRCVLATTTVRSQDEVNLQFNEAFGPGPEDDDKPDTINAGKFVATRQVGELYQQLRDDVKAGKLRLHPDATLSKGPFDVKDTLFGAEVSPTFERMEQKILQTNKLMQDKSTSIEYSAPAVEAESYKSGTEAKKLGKLSGNGPEIMSDVPEYFSPMQTAANSVGVPNADVEGAPKEDKQIQSSFSVTPIEGGQVMWYGKPLEEARDMKSEIEQNAAQGQKEADRLVLQKTRENNNNPMMGAAAALGALTVGDLRHTRAGALAQVSMAPAIGGMLNQQKELNEMRASLLQLQDAAKMKASQARDLFHRHLSSLSRAMDARDASLAESNLANVIKMAEEHRLNRAIYKDYIKKVIAEEKSGRKLSAALQKSLNDAENLYDGQIYEALEANKYLQKLQKVATYSGDAPRGTGESAYSAGGRGSSVLEKGIEFPALVDESAASRLPDDDYV